MAEDNRLDNDNNKRPNVPPRTWMVWVAIIGGILMLVMMLDKAKPSNHEITQTELFRLKDAGLLVPGSGKINYTATGVLQEITGKYWKSDKDGKPIVGDDGKKIESGIQSPSRPSAPEIGRIPPGTQG